MGIRCSYCGEPFRKGKRTYLAGEPYHLRCAVSKASVIKDRYLQNIMGRRNVVGMGIGLRKNGELGIIVNVERKERLENLRDSDIIPRYLDDIRTDVVEVGKIRAPRPILKIVRSNINRRGYVRPAPGGVSVGHYRITAGTLGCVLEDSAGRRYILSNNHVLANENDAYEGDEIYQPGPYDGGTSQHTIGYLNKFVPLSRYEINYVDAAIAEVNPRDVRFEILGIGTPTGFSEPYLGEVVCKSGRTTGVTHGEITEIHATFKVEYEMGILTFDEQIGISSLTDEPFSEGGDSGSAIIDKNTKKIVALLFAGSYAITIANPINMVLEALFEM